MNMTINRILFTAAGLCALMATSVSVSGKERDAQRTERQMLSGQSPEDNVRWDFFCTGGSNSGQWTTIRVPSCWETEGFGAYNYGHDRDKASEKGLYKTTFTLPEAWKDRRLFIVFEGSMTDTKVTVNGRQAGAVHQGAFYRFKREITRLVKWGGKSNLLEVEVSKMSANASVNAAERAADFWVFGGIYRPVYVEAVPKEFIEYTSIDARHDGRFHLEVNLDKELADAEVTVAVREAATGRQVGSYTAVTPGRAGRLTSSSQMAGVQPWSAENPVLYDAVITVGRKGKPLHTITERFGFRTVQLRAYDGLYVNGKRMRLKGVNRHCFRPATGRSLSRSQSLEDALLIKEMNMNAVRMSHYPPDKHFLEICDSLGLYVIDELCAWQYPPYDTPVGTILVGEMLRRDINHPSIVMWANGNEGGFNFDLDPLFPQIDTQQRTVIHPWSLFGGINTAHYINYDAGVKELFHGRDIFLPTENLHGLYDGGHGAGLDDFWNLMLSTPISAGIFLWDFADQGLVRLDRGGALDTDKDHAADGILGPYLEKEGSFYTIKEIWSPIFVEEKYITPAWDGKLHIENRYDFTNVNRCHFSYTLARYPALGTRKEVYTGSIDAPDIRPGNRGELTLGLPADWQQYDVLYLTAKDAVDRELFTWSFELGTPAAFAGRVLASAQKQTVSLRDEAEAFVLSAAGVTVKVDKQSGLLTQVSGPKGVIPLANGPILIGDRETECDTLFTTVTDSAVSVDAAYRYKGNRRGTAYRFRWTMTGDGILSLDYTYRPQDNSRMAGVTFSFPEAGVTGATLFANGPYRVYNNRMKGGTLGVWDKTYNDAITGERWEYPEFKGYYSHFYGMRLLCPTPFEVYSGSTDVSLHLFTPTPQRDYDIRRNYTLPPYPAGNLSFMDAIPAVGTKFGRAENYGPQSQPHHPKGECSDMIYFKFN
jgi:hypothetical protein